MRTAEQVAEEIAPTSPTDEGSIAALNHIDIIKAVNSRDAEFVKGINFFLRSLRRQHQKYLSSGRKVERDVLAQVIGELEVFKNKIERCKK